MLGQLRKRLLFTPIDRFLDDGSIDPSSCSFFNLLQHNLFLEAGSHKIFEGPVLQVTLPILHTIAVFKRWLTHRLMWP